MSLVDAISYLATAASLVLSLLAIWLSIVFFRMSGEASKATTEASKDIAAGVERLEKLFDKMYSDTFSMMRDTVSDMRKHMWTPDEAEEDSAINEQEQKADEKIAELKKELSSQIQHILDGQKVSEAKTAEMASLFEKAIARSRSLELQAREETIREQILRRVRTESRRSGSVKVGSIVARLQNQIPLTKLVAEIEQLSDEGYFILSDSKLSPETKIELRSRSADKSQVGSQPQRSP